MSTSRTPRKIRRHVIVSVHDGSTERQAFPIAAPPPRRVAGATAAPPGERAYLRAGERRRERQAYGRRLGPLATEEV